MSTENHQKGKDDNLPPVTGYPDVGEAERRRQEGASSEHPQEFAADSAAGGDLLPNILAGLKYPARRKEILDFLHLRRERIQNAEVVLNVVGLLPADREYHSASEIAAELGNINAEYNRSGGKQY